MVIMVRFSLVIKHASVEGFSGLIKSLWYVIFVKKRKGKKWGYIEMGFWVKA